MNIDDVQHCNYDMSADMMIDSITFQPSKYLNTGDIPIYVSCEKRNPLGRALPQVWEGVSRSTRFGQCQLLAASFTTFPPNINFQRNI